MDLAGRGYNLNDMDSQAVLQIVTPLVQLGLFGFLINWAKSAFVDRVNDHDKRLQRLENFEEFKDKYLKSKTDEKGLN